MIALIFCGDLKFCPYIKRYIERIEKHNAEYNVYFWNRGNFDLELPSNYYYCNLQSELSNGKLKKFVDFIGFRKWLIKELEIAKPEKIVALSTLTGIILGSTLYKGDAEYVFDIRDYSYEHIPIFYNIEKKVIKHSYFTAISSKGFETFLPNNNYVIAHNFNRADIMDYCVMNKSSGVINFVWNGVVRYFEYQKQYLDALKNDDRFQIIFHGDGPDLDNYIKYCNNNNFKNVCFTGSYDNSKKSEILSNAHILNNCYGYLFNAGNRLKHAVSNRFYDGLIYRIPQLVEPVGYKSKWVLDSGVGTSMPVDDNFADCLYEYYRSIDCNEFNKQCEKELQKVIAEDDEYISKIDMFIEG